MIEVNDIGSPKVNAHRWNTPNPRTLLVDRPQVIHREIPELNFLYQHCPDL